MRVEDLKKKGASNVLIVFESGEKVTLSYEILLKRGIRKNSELLENELESLLQENEIFFIKQSAFRFLNRRVHSVYELKTKLVKKGFKRALISMVIESLQNSGYLDDNNFTVNFIDEKKNRYGWGNRLITAGLQKRGISRDIINEAIKTIPPEDGAAKALILLAKKYNLRSIEELDSVKHKMFSFLLSKGYEYDVTERAVEDYLYARKIKDQ